MKILEKVQVIVDYTIEYDSDYKGSKQNAINIIAAEVPIAVTGAGVTYGNFSIKRQNSQIWKK